MYNKLFESILDSSIWLEDNPTRIVWFTFLAAMDEDGFARFATLKNLALRAHVSDKEASSAVLTLESPDPGSSDPDNEGRRVERVPGGWVVLNAPKYKEMVSRVISREKTRQRVANFREKQAESLGRNAPVTDGNDEKQKVTVSSVSEYESASESDSNSSEGDARGADGQSALPGIDQLSGPDLTTTVEPLPSKPALQRRVRNHDPGTELSEDWSPADRTLAALCTKFQCEQRIILAHLPDFKLYWIHEDGAGTVKKPCGWERAFRNRIDQLAGYNKLYLPKQSKGISKHGPPQRNDANPNGWFESTVGAGKD